jgi:hypothetical protein
VAKKYPLEPLVTLLGEREKERAGTVRAALERAEEERAALARARVERERYQVEARAQRERERAALEADGVRARDLQQGELFRIGAERALGVLAAGEAAQTALAHAAEQAVTTARAELSRVNREKQVVERHHQRFDAEVERREELAREEAAADVALASRRGARRD